MSTIVPKKNTLYVLQLKEQVDETVFNYIDTSEKWDVAYAKLDALLKEAIVNFENYMEVNGEKPKEDTTSVLFLNGLFKLVYFHTISYYHLEDNKQNEKRAKVLELLILAANCIPNVAKGNFADYLKEIANSYEEISQVEGKQQEFEKAIIEQNNKISDCFAAFKKATELVIK